MKKTFIVCDLDGTLANIEHRRYLVESKPKQWDEFYARCKDDSPNLPVIEVVRALTLSYLMIIVSGRRESTRRDTIKWLSDNRIVYSDLIMRPDGDFRADDILKEEILNTKFNKEQILCVFDDRDKVVQMWRRNGLTCFQVADGNF